MWYVIVMYVLLIPGVALFLRSKHNLGGESLRTVAIKGACTTVIVLTAIAGTAAAPENPPIYALLVTAGLIFGLIGDVVICRKETGGMVSGMIFFALGHLSYIAAFLRLSRYAVWGIPIFAGIYLLLLLLVRKMNLHLGKLLIPTAIYAAIITAMVSLSMTIPCSVKYGFVLPVAAILFAVSDGILAYGAYGGEKSNALDSFGLYCYYIGQSLFAVSIYCLR